MFAIHVTMALVFSRSLFVVRIRIRISLEFCAYQALSMILASTSIGNCTRPARPNGTSSCEEIDNTAIEMIPFVVSVCVWLRSVHHLIHLTTIHSFSVVRNTRIRFDFTAPA